MKVVIAGGGTGGHLFPGIAVAQELKRRHGSHEILFVGSPRGIEKDAVPRAGFDVELLPVSGLRRMGLLGTLKGLLKLPLAILKAFGLIIKFRPDVAVSVGGYAAGPAVLAARLLGVHVVVMEQNAVAGTTNRILGKLAHRIVASLPVKGLPESKVEILGNPVRLEMNAVREESFEVHQPLRVLVFGGSQGARAINLTFIEMLEKHSELEGQIEVLHQTGRLDYEAIEGRYQALGASGYKCEKFIDAMAEAYKWSDIVICRAGATTIAELTVCGRPAILIPFPFAVDDHQTANARELEAAGAAIHQAQSVLDSEILFEHLQKLLTDRTALMEMATAAKAAGRPSAAADICNLLEKEGGHV